MGLRLDFIKSCKVAHCLGSWILRVLPLFPDKNCSQYLKPLGTGCVWTPAFLLEAGTLEHRKHRGLCDPPTPTSNVKLQDTMYHVLAHSVLGGMECFPGTSLGEISWKLEPGFFWTLPHGTFPSADFAWCSFTDVNRSCECDCTLSHVSPPRHLQNLWVVLGTSY